MSDMTDARFRDLADAFGGDIAKWPDEDRDAARALLSRSPEIASVLQEAAAFDTLLDGFMAEAEYVPQASVEDAALRQAGRFDIRSFLSTLWPFGGLWQPAAGLVAASAAGFIVGISLTDLPAETATLYDDQLTIVERALGAESLEIDQ